VADDVELSASSELRQTFVEYDWVSSADRSETLSAANWLIIVLNASHSAAF